MSCDLTIDYLGGGHGDPSVHDQCREASTARLLCAITKPKYRVSLYWSLGWFEEQLTFPEYFWLSLLLCRSLRKLDVMKSLQLTYVHLAHAGGRGLLSPI